MKCSVYQVNIDCDIAGYKQICYLGSCETTFKNCLGNHKKLFSHVKQKWHRIIKGILGNQKVHWNTKNHMEDY